MNEKLLNKIQEQIEVEKITPLPRYRFILLRLSFWLLAFLSILVGSCAVGVILFLFVDYHKHGLLGIPNGTTDILLMVPYVWIAVFALFFFIARKSIKHTKKGYQYSLRKIVAVSMLLSLIFGSILNFMGVGKITHELFSESSLYNFSTYDSKDMWSRPTVGKLAGVVVDVKDDNDFSVMDFNGHVWQIHLAEPTEGLFVPEASSTVRMFGFLESSSSIFIAHSVYEWEE